jgi:hypothetical protein
VQIDSSRKPLSLPHLSNKTANHGGNATIFTLANQTISKKRFSSNQTDGSGPPEFLESAPRAELKELILLVLRDVNR